MTVITALIPGRPAEFGGAAAPDFRSVGPGTRRHKGVWTAMDAEPRFGDDTGKGGLPAAAAGA